MKRKQTDNPKRRINPEPKPEELERLLPATDTQTFRQKFQRAFAQAFLYPFDALQDKLGTKTPDDDDIADAAEYFQVSPLLVRHVLVNKGVLERDGLNQQAG